MKNGHPVLLLTVLLLAAGCSEKSAQTVTPPEENLCIENEPVADYMSEVSYFGRDYSISYIDKYYYRADFTSPQPWHPRPVTLCREDGRSKVKIWNLTPGVEYSVTVDGRTRTFTPTGQVRMLYLPSLRNVRDLGGWQSDKFCKADGTPRKIRYGRLFRGGEMNTWRTLSEADRAMMADSLHISCELDLRSSSEAENITASPLGKGSIYFRNTSPEYAKALDSDTHCRSFLWILERLKEDRNIYFHCAKGADRTGTLAFLIEGLLGVKESDIAKDYELTSFFEPRARNGSDYRGLAEAVDKKLSGSDLCAKCEDYFIRYGATLDQIEEFRSIMLE